VAYSLALRSRAAFSINAAIARSFRLAEPHQIAAAQGKSQGQGVKIQRALAPLARSLGLLFKLAAF
jgi:hypothetical protein